MVMSINPFDQVIILNKLISAWPSWLLIFLLIFNMYY
jgi:hypothetical protein